MSHRVIVHLIALGDYLRVLLGVKEFGLDFIVFVKRNEIPNAAPVYDDIKKILLKKPVKRFVEALKAESLNQPFPLVLISEAYFDKLDKRRNVKFAVAHQQIIDELSAADCRHVEDYALNISFFPVVVEIDRSELTAVAESIYIDLVTAGESFNLLNILVELGGVFHLPHTPVNGEGEKILRTYLTHEILGERAFRNVVILSCFKQG